MSLFQFLAYHPLQRNQLARLNVREPNWTETLSGNTSFTGKVTIPENELRTASLRTAMEPDESALYIRGSNNQWMWGGIVVAQSWNENTNEISFTAVDWRSYLYTLFLGPKEDLSSDVLYSYTAVDQLVIAQDLASEVVGPGRLAEGRPYIKIGNETSPRKRDLNFRGLEFKTLGEQIDTMAKRDDGFEWDVAIDTHTDGHPIPRIAMHYPERGGLVNGLIFNDMNVLQKESIVRETTARRTRYWGTGEGPVSEALPFSQDTDPAIAEGFTLLKEGQNNWSGVVDLVTLSSHARAKRAYLNEKLNLVKFSVAIQNPDIFSYSVGDRCRVLLRSRWLTIDEESVRIIERQIVPEDGIVWITVNLNDIEIPEIDEGGSV